MYIALLVACAASLIVLKLAPFLIVGCFIAFLALPRERPRWLLVSWALASVLSFGAFVRFLIVEAMPGIVQAGTRASEDSAVSHLREILFAEDAVRRHPPAVLDPDRDGIGAAARVEELTGRAPLRGTTPLVPPVLERYPVAVETRAGPAVELGGFLFIVCLPQAGGGWTAQNDVAVDEESAERHFAAYAWPAAAGRGMSTTFFIDEHENIRFLASPNAASAHIGPAGAPACDAALARDAEQWQVWRNKKPRSSLPGDRP